MGLLRHKGNSSPSDSDQNGYILATTALLLIPLMIFAAFAVDVGAWYAEADKNQRAADAAALAAVIEMPDLDRAAAKALSIVQENGYENAVLVPITEPPSDFNAAVLVPQVKVERRDDDAVLVTILSKGEVYFGSVVLNDEIDITRFAAADYNLPVPMGSPKNIIGYGVSGYGGITTAQQSGLFLTQGGRCARSSDGDLRAAEFERISNGTTFNVDANGCDPTVYTDLANLNGGNPTYAQASNYLRGTAGNGGADIVENDGFAQAGYTYVVDIPGHASGDPAYDVTLHAFGAPWCYSPRLQVNGWVAQSGNVREADERSRVATWGGVVRFINNRSGWSPFDPATNPAAAAIITTLDFTVTEDVGSRLTRADDQLIGVWSATQPTTLAGMDTLQNPNCQIWEQITNTTFTSVENESRRLYINVAPSENRFGSFTEGNNLYALQARVNGLELVCDSRTVNTIPCPTISGLERLPIKAQGGGSSSFFLAEVGQEFEGKTLEITLYDTGENMDRIEVIGPAGNNLDFQWSVVDDGDNFGPYNGKGVRNNAEGTSGSQFLTVSTLLTNANDLKFSWWDSQVSAGSRWRFQGRELKLFVDLDNSSIQWAGTDGWFRIRYTPLPGVDVTDVSTWGVNVIGDPVRLTE